MKEVNIFTDGSCQFNGKDKSYYQIERNRNNISYGGWAFIVVEDDEVVDQFSGGQFETTNNRMELEAFHQALKYISGRIEEGYAFNIHCDSKYVIGALLFNVRKWQKNNWTTSMGDPVKNREKIETTYNLLQSIMKKMKEISNCQLKINYVKSHRNTTKLNFYNNLVDKLAKETAEKYLKNNKDKYNEIVEEKKEQYLSQAHADLLQDYEWKIEF